MHFTLFDKFRYAAAASEPGIEIPRTHMKIKSHKMCADYDGAIYGYLEVDHNGRTYIVDTVPLLEALNNELTYDAWPDGWDGPPNFTFVMQPGVAKAINSLMLGELEEVDISKCLLVPLDALTFACEKYSSYQVEQREARRCQMQKEESDDSSEFVEI